jgi:hypothetical protein
MASGHVTASIYRPNTRLHRPTLQREESSCQLGAVHTRGKTGKHLLVLSFTRFDPTHWRHRPNHETHSSGR